MYDQNLQLDSDFTQQEYAVPQQQFVTNTFTGEGAPVSTINGNSGMATGPTVTLSGGTTGLSFTASGNTISLSGTLVAANGGTGLSSYAQGDLLYASAATTISKLAKDANATRYLSNTGGSNNPAWAQVNLTNGVTGTLPLGNGGTGGTTAATARTSLEIDDIATKKSNLAAAVAPAVTDDNTAGYAIGSFWLDTTADDAYIALDVATGAAVWKKITP